MKAALCAMFCIPLFVTASCALDGPSAGTGGSAGNGQTAGTGVTSGGQTPLGGTTSIGGAPAMTGGSGAGGMNMPGGMAGTAPGAGSPNGGSGTAGTTTMAGTGGGGTSLLDVAAVLDNQAFNLPCGPIAYAGTERVCCNHPGGSDTMGVCNNNCPGNPDLALTGFQNRNDTVTFGGMQGTTYTVKIRVRGIVEPKHYDNCPKQTEGFCGGPNAAPAEPGAYNVYMMQVTGDSGKARYFLNALDENEEHSTFPLDYQVSIDIEGGASIQLVAADENCTAIKNCADDGSNDLTCNPVTHPDLADHPEIVQPVNGQFVVIDLVDVKLK
jgi:hypothetical protein